MKKRKQWTGLLLALAVGFTGILGSSAVYGTSEDAPVQTEDQVPETPTPTPVPEDTVTPTPTPVPEDTVTPTPTPTPAEVKNGWKKFKGQYYYYQNGVRQRNKLLKLDDGIYYVNKSGRRCYGWRNFKGNTYYFQKDGKAQLGWMKQDGNWYYFNVRSGFLYKNIMLIDANGKRYIFDQDGRRYRGWCDYKGKRYYIDKNGSAHVGWLRVDGNWYYFHKKTASMYKNRTVKTSTGKKYIFDSNGICKNRK